MRKLGVLCFALAILLSLSACGTSEETIATAIAETELASSTDTPLPPSETPVPTDTPQPTPTETLEPTPTPEPQIVFLRDAPGCDLQHDIIANSPIELHYGGWGSLNKAYAEGSWDLYVSTLTMDGEEIEGEKQPVRMSAKLVKRCGSGPPPEGAYATVYIARFEGIPPGVHYLEVTYGANGVIEDGWVQVGPGTFAIKYFTLYSATE